MCEKVTKCKVDVNAERKLKDERIYRRGHVTEPIQLDQRRNEYLSVERTFTHHF